MSKSSTPLAQESAPLGPDSIECPNCGAPLELGAVLASRIEEMALARIQHEVAATEARIRDEERDAVRTERDLERADLLRQLDELECDLRDSQGSELELRRRERDVEKRERRIELDLARRRKELRTEIEKEHSAEHEVAIREYEQQLASVRRELDDARRTARTGSAQERGLIHQTLLGDELQRRFPDDVIRVTPRGKRGADISQQVRTPKGDNAGHILWEAKATARWERTWLDKLAIDQVRAGADVAILVTSAPPPEGRGLHLIGRVWVVDVDTAHHIAGLVRYHLLQVARENAARTTTAVAGHQIVDYVNSPTFFDRVRQLSETLTAEQQALTRERTALNKHWATRQRAIDSGWEAMALLLGDLDAAGVTLSGNLPAEFPACAHPLELAAYPAANASGLPSDQIGA